MTALLDCILGWLRTIALGLLVWLVVSIPVAIAVGRRLNRAATDPVHGDLRSEAIELYGLDDDCTHARIVQAMREHLHD